MPHLHHCVSARSFRPLWMLEELQLPYALQMLPFPPRAHARDYLQHNPLGTVPLLVHGDVRMTESTAICQYLATLRPEMGMDVPPGQPDFSAYLNWLHLGEATLTFPQTLVLRYRHFEPPERRQPQVAEDLGLAPQWGPATTTYWQRLQARPAFQRALAAEQAAAGAQGVDPTPSPALRPQGN